MTNSSDTRTPSNRWLAVLAVALTLVLLSLSCSSTKSSKEGGGAPDFVLTSLEGEEVRLSQFKGKVVILDFWATWCTPCKLELPHFIELHQEYKDRGLVIIGVSLDKTGVREVASFVKEWKIPYVVVMGTGEVVRDYGGIRGVPTTFVIGKDGKIYRKYVGYRKKEVFQEDVTALLKAI